MGLASSVRLLDLRMVRSTGPDREAFGLEEGARVMQCSRLRSRGDTPLSYVVNRLPLEIAKQFDEHDWEHGSILETMEGLGMEFGYAEQAVRATLADALHAKLLETRIGAPILSVDRIVRTRQGQAVERVRADYRGEIYSLAMHRVPESATDGRPTTESLVPLRPPSDPRAPGRQVR